MEVFFIGRKVKYSKELKLKIVKRYLKGESASKLASEHGMLELMVSKIIKWVHRYEVIGEVAFDSSSTNKSYSSALKLRRDIGIIIRHLCEYKGVEIIETHTMGR